MKARKVESILFAHLIKQERLTNNIFLTNKNQTQNENNLHIYSLLVIWQEVEW